jgi:hypothetical protein
VAYTADINIVVKGQAAVNSLQKSLIEVGEKLDELAKKRIGPAATLETFNKQLREARSRLDEVVAGTSNETAAIKNYVTALGNANAASERQNRLISDEIKVREAATGQLEKLIARQQDFIARTDAAAQAAPKEEKKADGFSDPLTTGMFKLGSIPADAVGGSHIDVGTTLMNALNALKPDQVKAMTDDTRKLMETQKSLMGMLTTMKPMMSEGKQMMETS